MRPNMEDMGSPALQDLHLARHTQPLLDG
uniref:Uncharacterized protein n=1 Tax=Arundo donax TaxID=35708 RepID=A0A0A9BX98_ARUDO